ncbi:MAG: hypothetical protein ACP5I4_02195 [Oceanipulchritudo sp.]
MTAQLDPDAELPSIAAVFNESTDQNYLNYEAFLQLYDSGAPVLWPNGGSLKVIGFNWYIGQTVFPFRNRSVTRYYSGFSYVGNVALEIQAVLDVFATHPTEGYTAVIASSGSGIGDFLQTGPATDFDGDGLSNFMEYAFVLDPASGAHPVPLISGTIDAGGSSHLTATLQVREDPGLLYSVSTGSDLAGWTTVNLAFSGLDWSSTNPGILTVLSQSDLGDGVWQLTVRDETALAPAAPRFVRVGVQ